MTEYKLTSAKGYTVGSLL